MRGEGRKVDEGREEREEGVEAEADSGNGEYGVCNYAPLRLDKKPGLPNFPALESTLQPSEVASVVVVVVVDDVVTVACCCVYTVPFFSLL